MYPRNNHGARALQVCCIAAMLGVAIAEEEWAKRPM